MRKRKKMTPYERSLSRSERKSLRGHLASMNPPSGRERQMPWAVAQQRQTVLHYYYPNDEVCGHGMFHLERSSDNEIHFTFGEMAFNLVNRRGRIDIEPVTPYPRVEEQE